jgi:hypothetical protein
MVLELLLLLCALLAAVETAMVVHVVYKWPRKFAVHQYLEITGDYSCVRECACILERVYHLD